MLRKVKKKNGRGPSGGKTHVALSLSPFSVGSARGQRRAFRATELTLGASCHRQTQSVPPKGASFRQGNIGEPYYQSCQSTGQVQPIGRFFLQTEATSSWSCLAVTPNTLSVGHNECCCLSPATVLASARPPAKQPEPRRISGMTDVEANPCIRVTSISESVDSLHTGMRNASRPVHFLGRRVFITALWFMNIKS